VIQGTAGVASGQAVFTNPSNAGATLTSITVAEGGSGSPNDVSSVSLYENGTPVGSTSLSGGAAVFNLTQSLLPGQAVTFTFTTSYDNAASGTYQWSVTGASGTNGQALGFSGVPVGESTITVVQSTATPTPTATSTPTPTPSDTPTQTATATQTPWVGSTVVVYPNPVSGGPVNVMPPAYSGTADVEVQIFTTAFRKVQDKTFASVPSGTAVALELTDTWGTPLADGLYYVVVKVEGRRSVAKLLILR
jgi:hypothetical protein